MKNLYRYKSNRMLFGVCGGLAEYLEIDATWLRLALVLIALSSFGFAAIAYLVAAIIMPEDASDLERKKQAAKAFADDVEKKAKEAIKSTDETFRKSKRKKERPRVGLGIFFVILGLALLFKDLLPRVEFIKFWPTVLIIIGLIILLKRRRHEC